MAKKKRDNEEVTSDEQDGKRQSAALAVIKKKYGNVLNSLNESGNDIKTISTGSLGLDLALGRGGMALGRIYEVYGPNSSGKSTLGVHVVIQAQRRGMKCAYIDAEHAVDPQLFKNYGVDSDALDIIQAYGGEPNLDICEKLVQTGNYSVIVVDSVSALIPMAEAEAQIEDNQMALQARLMSKALRKITPQAAETETLIIFVNQTRNKLSTYGNPETTSGGVALAFWATGRISVRGPESKARRLTDSAGDVYGHTAEHEIVKNKLGQPFKKAPLNLIYGKGYDYLQEILDLAVSLDVIEKAGSWFRYKGENIAQGQEKTLIFLKENKETFEEVRNEIMLMTGLKEQYERHSNPGPLYSN